MGATVLIVPTLNAGELWKDWISAVLSQKLCTDSILVIDSESSDETVTLANDAGFKVYGVRKDSFNHGGTRRLAVEMCSEYEFVIFLTQDAVLADTESLKHILSYFNDVNVAAVCGRQLPRVGAGPIESHMRLFNYAGQSHVRTIDDAQKLGLTTAFISNSFAAYRMSSLIDVGGFPKDAIFGEDMYVATKLLLAGYKIAYAAEGCVYHSHDYTVMKEFKRYFDMGVFHAREPWIRKELGSAENKGMEFVISEMKYLWEHAVWSIPEALLRNIIRYAGFRVGLCEGIIPRRIKWHLSMNRRYFNI